MAVVICGLVALPLAYAQPVAPDSNTYRAQADVQLALVFQGIAEGGISRGLRLFGTSGRCQAWYDISEIIHLPPNLRMQEGDRLKLEYRCGKNREYISETGASVAWATAQDNSAIAWLHSGDIVHDRGRTWTLANPDNWFAPVAALRSQ